MFKSAMPLVAIATLVLVNVMEAVTVTRTRANDKLCEAWCEYPVNSGQRVCCDDLPLKASNHDSSSIYPPIPAEAESKWGLEITCSFEYQLFLHPTNCHKFIQCLGKVPIVITCPFGSVWAYETQACGAAIPELNKYIDCSKNKNPSGNPYSDNAEHNSGVACICPAYECVPYPHHTDCHKYTVCRNNVEIEITCPEGEAWSDSMHGCIALSGEGYNYTECSNHTIELDECYVGQTCKQIVPWLSEDPTGVLRKDCLGSEEILFEMDDKCKCCKAVETTSSIPETTTYLYVPGCEDSLSICPTGCDHGTTVVPTLFNPKCLACICGSESQYKDETNKSSSIYPTIPAKAATDPAAYETWRYDWGKIHGGPPCGKGGTCRSGGSRRRCDWYGEEPLPREQMNKGHPMPVFDGACCPWCDCCEPKGTRKQQDWVEHE